MVSSPNFHFSCEFPPDIQRQIFEELFEQSNGNAVELAHVSYQVNTWLEPMIFQGVPISCKTNTRNHRLRYAMFMNRTGTLQGAEKYTKFIQRLLVDDVEMAAKLLPLCPNIESLALLIEPLDATFLEPMLSPGALSFKNLRRLSIRWGILPSEHRSCRHPIFQGLTHLDIDFGVQSFWEGLFQLKNLKHLRLDMSYKDRTEVEMAPIGTILQDLPTGINYITCFHEAGQRGPDFITEGRLDLRVKPTRLSLEPTRIAEDIACGLEYSYRDMEDIVNSWIHPPRHYHDFWKRLEDAMDNSHSNNRMTLSTPRIEGI